jgi:hypothetical protein
VEFGPYRAINTIPRNRLEALPMGAVLRMDWHVPASPPMQDPTKGDRSTFHGGGVPEEMSALISPALSVRTQTGGVVREFQNGDPRGLPVQHGHVRPDKHRTQLFGLMQPQTPD